MVGQHFKRQSAVWFPPKVNDPQKTNFLNFENFTAFLMQALYKILICSTHDLYASSVLNITFQLTLASNEVNQNVRHNCQENGVPLLNSYLAVYLYSFHETLFVLQSALENLICMIIIIYFTKTLLPFIVVLCIIHVYGQFLAPYLSNSLNYIITSEN